MEERMGIVVYLIDSDPARAARAFNWITEF